MFAFQFLVLRDKRIVGLAHQFLGLFFWSRSLFWLCTCCNSYLFSTLCCILYDLCKGSFRTLVRQRENCMLTILELFFHCGNLNICFHCF